jgi:hypothetical protein
MPMFHTIIKNITDSRQKEISIDWHIGVMHCDTEDCRIAKNVAAGIVFAKQYMVFHKFSFLGD